MWKRNSNILTSMLMILWYLTPCVFINLCLCKNCIGQGHGCAKPQRWGTRWIPGFTLPKTGFQAKIYNIDQDICRIQWKKIKTHWDQTQNISQQPWLTPTVDVFWSLHHNFIIVKNLQNDIPIWRNPKTHRNWRGVTRSHGLSRSVTVSHGF